MPLRLPAAAGRFYPGDDNELASELAELLGRFEGEPEDDPVLLMLPHAGYVYSGIAAAAGLAGARLPGRVVILCPNHTGRGGPLGVWPKGAWRTPLGEVQVDEGLASWLCEAGPFRPDTASHLGEHAIEVQLPFLQWIKGLAVPAIVPVCVGTQNPALLREAGAALAAQAGPELERGELLLLVSSDMNHYEDEETTLAKDELALAPALAGDGEELLRVCREEGITMCGAAPMALALFALDRLRGGRPASRPARLLIHTSSADAFGERSRCVGYAALRAYL